MATAKVQGVAFCAIIKMLKKGAVSKEKLTTNPDNYRDAKKQQTPIFIGDKDNTHIYSSLCKTLVCFVVRRLPSASSLRSVVTNETPPFFKLKGLLLFEKSNGLLVINYH